MSKEITDETVIKLLRASEPVPQTEPHWGAMENQILAALDTPARSRWRLWGIGLGIVAASVAAVLLFAWSPGSQPASDVNAATAKAPAPDVTDDDEDDAAYEMLAILDEEWPQGLSESVLDWNVDQPDIFDGDDFFEGE